MESPPNFSPPKQNKTGLIIGLVIGGVVLCCIVPIGGIAGLGFWGYGKAKGMIQCTLTATLLSEATRDYTRANGGKLPDAAKWNQQLAPYYSKQAEELKDSPFKATDLSNGANCDSDGTITGLAYNVDLSGKNLKQIKDQVSTIVFFEIGKTGPNLSAKYARQPKETSPMIFGKHRGWTEATLSGEITIDGKRSKATGSGFSVESKGSASGTE